MNVRSFGSLALKFVIALVGLGAIFGVIIAIKVKQFSEGAPPVFPPVTVTSAEAVEMIWEQTIHAIGTFRAEDGIQVSAEVSGIIDSVNFVSGQNVEAGDIILELDTSVERAQLEAALAAAELAQISLNRFRDLRRTNSASQADLDAAEATAKETAANVEAIEARIALKTIRAPFDGRLGIRRIDPGEFINAGQAIVALQALDPILLDFTLPQDRLSQVEPGLEVRVTLNAWPGEVFSGEIRAIDPVVDEVTRSFRLEAIFPNKQEKLRPGMFAEVRVILPEAKTVVAVPATSIYHQSYGDTLYAIVPAEDGSGGLVAEQRFVRTGANRGDYTAVVEGIEPGEQVVTSGVFKLSNGRPVVVDNSQAPQFSLNPQPANR